MTRTAALFAAALLCGLPASSLADDAHAAVGAEKCAKTCHKIQLASWTESAHAKATPRVECETCHGNGADYMKLKVMKDPAQAEAAGLIAKPALASCTQQCHQSADKPKPTAEALAKVHAHKPKK